MKKSHLLIALLSLAAASAPSLALAKKNAAGDAPASTAPNAVMAKYDKNGNGVLDDTEKEAVQAALEKDPDLKAYDKNGDGKLDESELAALAKPAATSGEAPRRKRKKQPETTAASASSPSPLLAKYDKDGNGTLDDAEKEALRADFDKDPQVKGLDTNGDGKIDDSELAAGTTKPAPSTAAAPKKKKKKNKGEGAPPAPLTGIMKYDKNGDGVLDETEKETLRTDFADLKKLDKNADGKIDDDEIAAGKAAAAAEAAPMKKKKKKKDAAQ